MYLCGDVLFLLISNVPTFFDFFRYIEVFKSSKNDVKYVVPTNDDFRPLMSARPGPYDRPQGFLGQR